MPSQVRRVVEEMMAAAESKKPAQWRPPLRSDEQDFSATLERDPNNVPALILRGQIYCTETKMHGRLRSREAFNDFEKAAQCDEKLADPHYGLGSVLYRVSLFNLADRGLFKIHEKGAMLFDKQTAAPRIRPQKWEFYADERDRLVLQGALDQFQTCQRRSKIPQKRRLKIPQ